MASRIAKEKNALDRFLCVSVNVRKIFAKTVTYDLRNRDMSLKLHVIAIKNGAQKGADIKYATKSQVIKIACDNGFKDRPQGGGYAVIFIFTPIRIDTIASLRIITTLTKHANERK